MWPVLQWAASVWDRHNVTGYSDRCFLNIKACPSNHFAKLSHIYSPYKICFILIHHSLKVSGVRLKTVYLVCPFSLNVTQSRQDVDPELVMSLTLLLEDRPVGRVSMEMYITKLLVVLIIARRSIIPGESYSLAFPFISIIVARLA